MAVIKITMHMIEWGQLEHYLTVIDPKKRIEDYQSRFKRIKTFFDVHEFTYHNALILKDELKKEGLSNSSINNHIKIIKLICRYYFHYEIEYDARIERLEYEKKKKIINRPALTPAQIKKIAYQRIEFRNGRQALKRPQQIKLNARYTAAILLMALGLRISEIVVLRWEHIYEDHVNVQESGDGKTESATRQIYITPKLYKMIMALERYSHGYVFGSNRGRGDANRFNDVLHLKTELVGIDIHVTTHVFRHSFITHMLKKGKSIAWIAKHVGHKNWSATKEYEHLCLNESEKLVRSHDLFKNKGVDGKREQLIAKIHEIDDPAKLQAVLALL